jgi:quercetin dioxygenase-like cupin family protein
MSDANIPADDLKRQLVAANPEEPSMPHIGLVGGTYTVLLSGHDTSGRYCLIDMYVQPGGGPPPHRHDFEETFIVLDGELEARFRGETRTVRGGETIHIPANAPHQFRNSSSRPARMFCICSPAGQEEFFQQLGNPVPSRTAPPPELDQAQQAAFIKKAMELAPKYRTELLKEA